MGGWWDREGPNAEGPAAQAYAAMQSAARMQEERDTVIRDLETVRVLLDAAEERETTAEKQRDAAIARADRLTTCTQMCCDGSSEDEPAALCARRVSELLARAEKAERLCVELYGKVAKHVHHTLLPTTDERDAVEAMRARVKP